MADIDTPHQAEPDDDWDDDYQDAPVPETTKVWLFAAMGVGTLSAIILTLFIIL